MSCGTENAVVLIEWGEKFTAHLPTPRLQIDMEDQGGDKRRVTVIDQTEDRWPNPKSRPASARDGNTLIPSALRSQNRRP